MDRILVEARSKNMAAVKSHGNTSTELALIKYFRKNGIKGWRRHIVVENIRPDFVFHGTKTVLFVHGCFWHGCPEHGEIPKTSTAAWTKKIASNRIRDKRQKARLRSKKWSVIVVWEHDLRTRGSSLRLRRILYRLKSHS